jgi:transposase
VDKIEDMRKRGRRGESVASISRETGVSEPTVRKYLRMQDLSPERPRAGAPESELLAPYAARIDAWLDDDCRNWRKQRHTATRVYVRLRDELGYGGSYSTVQRYVKRRREEMAAERDRRDSEGYLQLEWLPGECQVDFGEADFRVRGVVTRGRYLTVTFPHSNVGPAQVFWGETSECVCQGPGNVFEFAGGAPRRAVFDNATEVGRRVGPEVRVSELFRRFAAHYGLDYSFTNPYSGNEKGNVENKVGAHRRNLFVPVPSFHDVRAFNARLLGDCLDLSEGKRHYRLGAPELELFARDREALSPPAADGLLLRQVGDAQVRQAGRLHRRRRAPLLGGPRLRPPQGRRGAGRLRRHGLRLRDRRGHRHPRAAVGRGSDGQLRPDAAAQAAVHATGRLARLLGEVLPAGRARLLMCNKK